MSEQSGISIAYSGVHTAYQQALAAAEANLLKKFFTALEPRVGFYGRMATALVGEMRLISRGVEGVPRSHVCENPFTLLRHSLAVKLKLRDPDDWYAANDAFDRWAARGLMRCAPQAFIGFETCALHCLTAAKKLGAKTILESPQAHPAFLNKILRQGTDCLGLPAAIHATRTSMDDRRDAEFSLADHFLVYSDIHANSFAEAGFQSKQIHAVPLWADPVMWKPRQSDLPVRGRKKLRLLFVGSVNLRKGIPWLLEAMRLLRGSVELTLIGSIDEQIRPWLNDHSQFFTYLPSQPRYKLLEHYQRSDLFILPSLLDTFGFVAMEAMMTGLPAIVSSNSGCPVPSLDWRIPVMNAEAIAQAVQKYDDDRELLKERAAQATTFSRNFTAAHYRENIRRRHECFVQSS